MKRAPICKIAQETGGEVPMSCLFKCERGDCAREARVLENQGWPGRTLLCVDMSYQVYRASAAHPSLTSRGRFTGGLYGFLQALAKMQRETQATHHVFGKDVKPYKRSLEYPEYKQVRKKAADPELKALYDESIVMVYDFLAAANIEAWGIPGFEFDDLAGHVVRRHRGRFDRIYAASNDSDLWQLLDALNFRVYATDVKHAVGKQELWDRHGITPQEYLQATALTGTHNDVAGIDGVGLITAVKALRDPVRMRAYRAEHAEMIDRNARLILLPHPEFPSDARPPWTHRVNVRAAYRFCAGYDIQITPGMENALQALGGTGNAAV